MGNSVLFAIGNFGSKLMQFVMVPLYSYVLTTTEFGKVNIITNVVSLLGPIACLDLSDAVFRYALDKVEDKDEIFSTGLYYIVILSLISILVGYALSFFISNYSVILATILLVTNNIYNLISNFTRSLGYVKEYAISGIVSTFSIGLSNILFLVVINLGIRGYLVSLILGPIIASIYLIITCGLHKYCDKSKIKISSLRRMLKYSLPLIPNSLAWWINSTSDSIFIMFFLGASENGIYAIANKIPNILNTIIGIFFQSWQISVVEEFNKPNSKKFITNVFGYFFSFIFFLGIGLVTFARPIFHLLLSKNYYIGWKLVPFFVLATIYISIASFTGIIYTAFKQTGPILVTTIYGAIVNIVVTVITVPRIGSVGAVIANIVSFLIISIIRIRYMLKINKLSLNYSKIVLLHFLFIIISIIVLLNLNDILTYVSGCLVLLLQFIFDSNLKSALQPIINKYVKRQN